MIQALQGSSLIYSWNALNMYRWCRFLQIKFKFDILILATVYIVAAQFGNIFSIYFDWKLEYEFENYLQNEIDVEGSKRE